MMPKGIALETNYNGYITWQKVSEFIVFSIYIYMYILIHHYHLNFFFCVFTFARLHRCDSCIIGKEIVNKIAHIFIFKEMLDSASVEGMLKPEKIITIHIYLSLAFQCVNCRVCFLMSGSCQSCPLFKHMSKFLLCFNLFSYFSMAYAFSHVFIFINLSQYTFSVHIYI